MILGTHVYPGEQETDRYRPSMVHRHEDRLNGRSRGAYLTRREACRTTDRCIDMPMNQGSELGRMDGHLTHFDNKKVSFHVAAG